MADQSKLYLYRCIQPRAEGRAPTDDLRAADLSDWALLATHKNGYRRGVGTKATPSNAEQRPSQWTCVDRLKIILPLRA